MQIQASALGLYSQCLPMTGHVVNSFTERGFLRPTMTDENTSLSAQDQVVEVDIRAVGKWVFRPKLSIGHRWRRNYPSHITA